MGSWKAVRVFAGKDTPERFELFNLASDPGETRSVAGSEALAAERMRRCMAEAHRYHPDFPLPVDK